MGSCVNKENGVDDRSVGSTQHQKPQKQKHLKNSESQLGGSLGTVRNCPLRRELVGGEGGYRKRRKKNGLRGRMTPRGIISVTGEKRVLEDPKMGVDRRNAQRPVEGRVVMKVRGDCPEVTCQHFHPKRGDGSLLYSQGRKKGDWVDEESMILIYLLVRGVGEPPCERQGSNPSWQNGDLCYPDGEMERKVRGKGRIGREWVAGLTVLEEEESQNHGKDGEGV